MLVSKIQLDADEVILLQVRKHWFVLTMQMLSVIIMAITPLIFWIVLDRITVAASIAAVVNVNVLASLYTGWLIISWMALFSIWTNYYLDVWTITNKRFITVDQRGLFNRYTGSFRLERLQDINVSITGIIATFLNFGDLTAETASEDQNFVARSIPRPQEMKALILHAADDITFKSVPTSNEGTTATALHHVNDGL